MKEIHNEDLKIIVDQISDTAVVRDDVIDFIEDSDLKHRIGEMRTELGYLLEADADIGWYKLANDVCSRDDSGIWMHEIADCFKRQIPVHIVRESLEDAGSVRKFKELVEWNVKMYEEEQAKDRTKEVTDKGQLRDTVSLSYEDRFANDTMRIAESYMDMQVATPISDAGSADELITLAMRARDTLKEYTDRIHDLEQVVASQKQLLERQRETMEEQEREISDQKAMIEKYESQLEQVSRQYKDMNQTLIRLNNIQTELRMLEKEE